MDSKPHILKPIRIKIISIGNEAVGKSCLIKRYYEKRFVPKYLATIGIDYGVTRTVVDNMDVCVNIFDLSGDPLFYEVRNEFYKDTHGALLVYDVTNRKSFESLKMWLMEMQHEMGDNQTDFDRAVIVVCANKVDKQKRAIDEVEGRLWADLHAFPYFETSAYSGIGVQVMFQTLFTRIVKVQELDQKNKTLPQGFSTPKAYGDFNSCHAEAVFRLLHGKDDYEKLGLPKGSTVDGINKAYRKLAVMLHPDKAVIPGSEEAFKILVSVRSNLLRTLQE